MRFITLDNQVLVPMNYFERDDEQTKIYLWLSEMSISIILDRYESLTNLVTKEIVPEPFVLAVVEGDTRDRQTWKHKSVFYPCYVNNIPLTLSRDEELSKCSFWYGKETVINDNS